MPATQRGIYHNLKESKYTVSNTEIVFFFSSKLYRKKFLDEYQEHREKFSNRFEEMILDKLNINILADITLYMKIEKRGFRACLKRNNMYIELSKDELYQYSLRKMNHNTLEWCEV